MSGTAEFSGAEPVAIIGMAVRVPGANDLDTFWRNLVDGVESINFFTRAELLARGADEAELDDPNFVAAGGIIDEMEYFDAAFFGFSAREAQLADPQLRIFLEQAHAALLDAGYDPFRYPGDVAVYAGAGAPDYHWRYLRRNRRVLSGAGDLGLAVGNRSDYIAATVSYRLDLRGPALTLHTACSSSLVAVHLATEALRGGECDMALAGGVSVDLPAGHGFLASEGYISPDGHCRPFDAHANGTIWGSGAGVVLLKRLPDAIHDGDRIYAVVLGNAINNDGATKVGFAAPSVEGQTEVVRQALAVASIEARSIGYVEAHGTGTTLGDPIEVSALAAAYRADPAERGWCGIGSVKSNIGHLSQAAGVVGLVKAALMVHHGLIPPSINFTEPNPSIDFESSPFYVAAMLSRWDIHTSPRRAAVSSFGVGGTNAHVVIEQAPPAPARPPTGPGRHLVQVSARTATASATAAARLAEHLSRHDRDPRLDGDLDDVAYTLRVGRTAYRHRVAVVAADVADAAAALREPARLITGVASQPPPQLAMLFSGQGAQYAGMGRELYRHEAAFAEPVDECAELLAPHLGEDIRTHLLAEPGPDGTQRSTADELLRQTRLTQPALFTVEYALAMLWRRWGVQPSGMIGHSIGEYVAATLAGVFALADALRLVALRGALMDALPPGAMLAVQRGEDEVATRLADYQLDKHLSIATINGPGMCVVSGPVDATDRLAQRLKADRVRCTPLRTSHAFHSAMLDPIIPEFTAAAAAVPRHPPRIRFLSNVTGDWITAGQATDPEYWATHLRAPVRFGACVAALLASAAVTLLECGPGRSLAGLARMQQPHGAPPPLHSLPGPTEPSGDLDTIYATAARLWIAGVPVDVGAGRPAGRRVGLPGYPYERVYHWVSRDPDGADGIDTTRPAPPARRGIDDWFEVPVWGQVAPAPASQTIGRCLVFTADARGEALVDQLRAQGADPIVVRPGGSYTNDGSAFTLRPSDGDDYAALESALAATGGLPQRIIHAWALGGEHLELGFTSLVRLAQMQAQALAQAQGSGPRAGDTRLDVLTANTLDVRGDEPTSPLHASVAGVVAVAPQEIPGLRAGQIDLDGAAFEPAQVAAQLCRPAEVLMALRGGRLWRRGFAPASAAPVSGPGDDAGVLRSGGRYLITGGLGGIGISIAEDIAMRCQGRLALLTRGGLPPRPEWDVHLAIHGGHERVGRAIEAIRRMEQAGASVLVLTGDVAVPDDLRRVRREIWTAFGGLDAIVHAAGIAGGGMIEVKATQDAHAVLAPKVAGTLGLADVFGDTPLDFVALCSSVTAVAGDLGQVDYCAANAFLDAFAHSHHPWPGRVISVNWGGWSEVGMAVETAGTTRAPKPVHSRRLSPGSDWLLDEHRVAGTPVLPGTALLEEIRAALAATVPAPRGGCVELRDVAFVEPLSVPDGAIAELRVHLTPAGAGYDVEVTSLCGGWARRHARGSAGWVIPGPAVPHDLAAIRARCRRVGAEQLPAAPRRTGLVTLGPRWSEPTGAHVGVAEELALIEASPDVAAELPDWVLHPALLDVATAFSMSRGQGSYLPFGYGQVLVRGPLPARFYSHLRYRDLDGGGDYVIAADLTLLDPDGLPLVEIGEFLLRRVEPEAIGSALRTPGPPGPATISASPGRIAPSDGVRALWRVLAAPDLGPQVVVSALAIGDMIQAAGDLAAEAHADAHTAAAPLAVAGGHQAPRGDLAATIAAVWRDVLGVNDVGTDSDFFDLGGNSLVAVALISSMRRVTGVRLPMRALFESPTVGALAARVEQLRTHGGTQAPVVEAVDETSTVIPRLARP